MCATERFDHAAPTWDLVDRRVQLARGVTEAILARVPLSTDLSVLDFGCGTGLVTLPLASRVGAMTGADTSAGMLETLDGKARSQGLSVALRHLPAEGNADLGGPYDLILSSMTLHHVADVAGLFKHFSRHLRRGGRVALADLDAEDGTFHEDGDGVHHHGFSRELIRTWLEEAGFGEIEVESATATTKQGKAYSVFLATGHWMGGN